MGHESPVDETPHVLEAGSLSREQCDLVLRHLPVHVSVIDEGGVLLYWHGALFDGCDPASIGRHINACHAPSSRPTIDRMIAAFAAGTRDEATFWRREDGALILYRYIALRDAGGTYRGMLETMEDISGIVGLQGERRELDW
jgi:DUF438 domain-containing protein